MTNGGFINSAGIKLITFALVAVLHVFVIVYVAFRMDIKVNSPAPVAGVMKLFDVDEEMPLLLAAAPPSPPPLSEENSDMPPLEQELIAENLVETDETPPPSMIGGRVSPDIVGVRGGTGSGQINYLPQRLVSKVPVLPEDEIRRATIYPPIAQRSNIEGSVYLELFVDRQGNVREVGIIRENPPNRGFGQAAVNAFKGIRGIPAEANGEPVAVRYRYNVSFKLK